MKTAITDLPDKTREQITQQALQVADSQTSSCPLLVNDRCSIYEARPVICRTQGLPLLLETADGTPEVDFCPLNFTAENAVDDLTENNLVPLDKINLQLAILNLRYCRAHGIPDEQSGERIKTADVILRAMTQVRS